MADEREKILEEYQVTFTKHSKEEENLRKSIIPLIAERFELRDKKKDVIKT